MYNTNINYIINIFILLITYIFFLKKKFFKFFKRI